MAQLGERVESSLARPPFSGHVKTKSYQASDFRGVASREVSSPPNPRPRCKCSARCFRACRSCSFFSQSTIWYCSSCMAVPINRSVQGVQPYWVCSRFPTRRFVVAFKRAHSVLSCLALARCIQVTLQLCVRRSRLCGSRNVPKAVVSSIGRDQMTYRRRRRATPKQDPLESLRSHERLRRG
ncbi:hypothetical protein EVAR_73917_1 [Eumeta japonica]|uniref:Uncharacterized protein n=1 Tax=Eumeta variegata TaxID=151549 RepID=A0A4C1SBL0_EUMVA|nr:hypothetical protein EVAR_73917_1 [Eumeta japonica]